MKRFTITHLLLFITWFALAISWGLWNWQDLPYTGRYNDGWELSFNDALTMEHVTIDERLFAKSPAWNPKAKHPPLSAKEAISAINRFRVSNLTESDNWEWSLTSIGLHPLDADNHKWCWIALFDASVKEGGSSGPPIQYAAYVMMDGRVIGMEQSDYYDSLIQLGLVPDPDFIDYDNSTSPDGENNEEGGVF